MRNPGDPFAVGGKILEIHSRVIEKIDFSEAGLDKQQRYLSRSTSKYVVVDSMYSVFALFTPSDPRDELFSCRSIVEDS